MSGKSPICEDDLIRSLRATFEPRFPASAICISEDAAVKFLLGRGILKKAYETTVICRRCPKTCEVVVQTDEGGERFFICPTGYLERPVPVSEEDVASYAFDYATFARHFAKDNGLKAWTDRGPSSSTFRPLARGRKTGKRVVAVYTSGLQTGDALVTLSVLKKRLKCEKLIVVAPESDDVDKTVVDALAADDIRLASLDGLLAEQSFDLQLAEEPEAPPPADAYCKVVTHGGEDFLNESKYRALFEARRDYDMFIDGFEKKVWKRTAAGRCVEEKLTPSEFEVLAAYIRSGKVRRPARFNSTIKVFETARRKADVKTSRYTWRTFRTHRTPADPSMKQYQFAPPPGFKFCLTIPLA